MNTKPWWQSKTLWFNALGLSIVTVQALAGTEVLSPGITVPVLAIGNAILRFVTTQPVG